MEDVRSSSNSVSGPTHPDDLERSALLNMINGFWLTQMIYVAAELRIADILANGPKTSADIAEKARADPDALYRVMRALASRGIFHESAAGVFSLNRQAELLRSDIPGSLHGIALYSGDNRQFRYSSWGDLISTVKTGRPAFPRLTGMKPFEYLSKNPDLSQVFDSAMASYTSENIEAILRCYDFSGYKHIVDVGGGNGSLLCEILKQNADTCGTVFDLQHIVEGAQTSVARNQLTGRVTLQGGSFFEEIPAGGDLYMMKCVLHDWSDHQALEILRVCRRAMREQQRLLLVEAVILPGNEPCLGKLMDINMLVIHGGRERSETEFKQLLKDAGFELTKTIITGSTVDLIEAVPV